MLVLRSVPATPGIITGTAAGLCTAGTTSATYSILPAAGATSYTWVLPSGATITNGDGTNSIEINFGSGFVSGNLSVKANNSCGSSPARNLALKSLPALPGIINGPAIGLCPAGTSSATYSIVAVSSATSYTWTVPSGASISGGQGTNTVNVNFGSSFSSGNISVTADNVCGSSSPRTLALKSVTAIPGIISGTIKVTANSSGDYSISAVPGASGYTWSVTGDANVSSDGTN